MTENKRFYIDHSGDLWDQQSNDILMMDFGYDKAVYVNAVLDLLNELAEENQQLKKENYELHKRLGDFEPFERYMKEITSKTSLEDIIGIVKTGEPTNSVELKKELYK